MRFRLYAFVSMLFISAVSVSGAAQIEHSARIDLRLLSLQEDSSYELSYYPEIEADPSYLLKFDIIGRARLGKDDNDLELYRAWCRLILSGHEFRIGLQQLNFGPARILRPLQWFDTISPADTFSDSEGVKGLLYRYYGTSGANIWVWGLYGSNTLKGIDSYITEDSSIEPGLRIGLPFLSGEVGFTGHSRNIDRDGSSDTEKRLALDGIWDIGPGIWFESVFKSIKPEKAGYHALENYLSLGTDYTFPFAAGVLATAELMFYSDTEEVKIDSLKNRSKLCAISLDGSVNLTDNLRILGYFDLENTGSVLFAGYTRSLEDILIDIGVFTGDGVSGAVLSGSGAMLTLSYSY
jgi:hypothetical protein